jgi:hypothetical protein
LQIKTKIVSCHTVDSKPVKQEVNGTVILPPLVFPALTIRSFENAEIYDFCQNVILPNVVEPVKSLQILVYPDLIVKTKEVSALKGT